MSARIEEIRVIAQEPGFRHRSFDIMRFGRTRQLAGPGSEFGTGRGRARTPVSRPPPPLQPMEEIVVTGRRIARTVGRLGGPAVFIADIGARIIDELSRQRLDELGRDITRTVPARPDTPVRTIPPEVIPEIIVTGTRPAPRPISPPRRTVPRRTTPVPRRPFRPPRRRPVTPPQPAPPVIPAPTVPQPSPIPRTPSRTTPIPPLRWPMNPNLPVPATPGVPRFTPMPTLPRPEFFPDVSPRPVSPTPATPSVTPTIPGVAPTPVAPIPGGVPFQPAPLPSAPPATPVAPIAPSPVPGIFPFATPLPEPVPLTEVQTQVVGSTEAVPFVIPQVQLQAAQCQPCPSKKKKEERRKECWKKLVEEREFERWDQVWKWQEIDCSTGRPV